MEGSAVQVATPAEAVALLAQLGHEKAIAVARREYEEVMRVARGRHPRSEEIDYRRGRWHAAVKMLAVLAGLEVLTETEEPDLLEFAHALSSYSLD